MDKKIIASMIDHAVLKPDATDEDVIRECGIAREYGVASVCVKPCHVELAKGILKESGVLVSTVIGFPHGSNTTECKVFEAEEAIKNGATELDMVINIGKLMAKDYEYVKNDIFKIINCAHENHVMVKCIIETALLDESLIKIACEISKKAGADYVKTSTGFNGRGACLSDIVTMKKAVGEEVKIKASGGIKTMEECMEFARAGCSRLGTSATVHILS